MSKFRTILADPPWDYRNGGRGSEKNHYCTLGIDGIINMPVEAIAEKNAVLLLWGTMPLLPEALRVMDGWGFRFKSAIPWVKVDRHGIPKIGLGFYARACSELLLIGIRGEKLVPAESDRPVGVLFNDRGRHSAKPEAQYDFAEAYGGPFLEIFARPDGGLFPARENWTRIGNEITGRSVELDLQDLANDVPLPSVILGGKAL